MPSLPDVPNVLKVQLHWQIEGDPMGMTNHYWKYTGGAPNETTIASIASNVVSLAETYMAPVVGTHAGVLDATVTDLTSMTSAQATAGTAWVGSEAGSPLPPGAAVLVNHQIGRRYRGGKPRSYMPWGTASDLTTDGVWSTAAIGNFDSAWGGWVAGFSDSTYSTTTVTDIVSISYYDGFTSVENPITHRWRNVPTLRAVPLVDLIVAHTVLKTVASQRRRNRDA